MNIFLLQFFFNHMESHKSCLLQGLALFEDIAGKNKSINVKQIEPYFFLLKTYIFVIKNNYYTTVKEPSKPKYIDLYFIVFLFVFY